MPTVPILRWSVRRWGYFVWGLWFVSGTVVPADDGVAFFESKIRPVLIDRCYACHSEQAKPLRGGLRLDTRDGALKGGESGAAVVPADHDKSLLIAAIRYDGLEMPPDGKLPPDQIQDFERWITMGAPDPREGPGPPGSTASAVDWTAARQFWSFQPPRSQLLPTVTNRDWPRLRSDVFVMGRLEHADLAPNPPADRATLIRRVTMDLTGLPVTAGEVTEFLRDESPLAYEQLIDRLLASPRNGERWARFWLDLGRYAEDQAHIVGNDRSLCYPNAYLYRDWVIQSWNGDLPYDQFVRRQLAADVMDPKDSVSHVALGFIGLGPKYYRRNAPEVMADEWEDRVDIVARGLLGLTIACARCHDHKYDPIPTADYYALAGVFASTEMFNRPMDDKVELDKSGQAKNPEQSVHMIRDREPKDLKVQIRGDYKHEGPVITRGFPQILSPDGRREFSQGSGRLELADAIVSPANPLVARVIVNRVWGELLGQPLAGTPSNLGKLGELPSHPELLDDLAVRFQSNGWSLKWLQREIVVSAAYRQSSAIDSYKQSVDGANRMLWRANRRRLSIEAWRDSILAVAGRLDSRIGGPSVDLQDTAERRRTIYSQISRLKLDPLLAAFDFPDPNVHSERRNETTTPLQKLFALNSPFMITQAESLAEMVVAESQADEQRIAAAFRQVFAREPAEAEVAAGRMFLAECGTVDDRVRWSQFAQVLLASNELLILD